MLAYVRNCLIALFIPALALSAQSVFAQPSFTNLQPADGTLLSSGQGTLSGDVADAETLTIDGAQVPIEGGSFSYAFDLEEGQQVIQLVADGAGGQTAITHTLTLDSLAPAISVTSPSAPVVSATPLLVAGTATDPHLVSVTVNGQAATLSGGAWSISMGLTEGHQTLSIRAEDSLGHASVASVDVALDTIAPTLTVSESGQNFTGGLFNRPVTPVVTMSDATDLSTEIRLDGALFVSGTTISSEGAHTLTASATDAAGWVTSASIDFTLDLTAPTLGVIAPATGTVLATTTVDLTVEAPGASQVRVAGVVSSGSTPFSLTVPLSEGVNDLLVEALDEAGNRVERIHRLSRDTTAPALTVATPVNGDVVASSPIRVAGTASDQRLQEVRVNGLLANLVGTTFEVVDMPLIAGANVIDVVATDSLGNETTQQLTVTLDQTAPTFSVTANAQPLASGATFSSDVTLSITVDDPTATLDATLDGGAFTSPTTVTSDGQHELSVTVTSTGGVSASALYLFEIDRQSPVFGALTPADGHVQSGTEVTLTGQLTKAVLLQVDGQAANLFGEDFSAGPFTLAEGVRTFTLVATGANGLETTITHRIERDTTAPLLTVQSPAADTLTAESAVDVSGTFNEAHPQRVTVSGVEATLSGSTFLARGVALSEGLNTLTIVAEDVAGNSSEVTRQVTSDSQAPEISITDPTSGTTVPESSYLVRGMASDAHLDRVEVEGRQATLDQESGEWSVSVPLAEGENSLVATVYDRVGQSGSATVSIYRDNEAPAVQITVPSEGASLNVAEIEVRGAVEDEEGTTVKVNSLEAFVDQGIFYVTVPLSPGENVLTARSTDSQGNEGVHTRTVIRDETPPAFLGSDPDVGALELPLGATFRLEFSEAMTAPETGELTLKAGSQTLSFDVVQEASALIVTPSSPLPPAATITLTLTPGLEDLAGNALSSVPEPLSWTTLDTAAPPAPVLSPQPPSYLCAPSLTLLGTATPGELVEAQGGAAAVRSRVDPDGNFTLVATLLPDRLNRLDLSVIDSDGDRSVATTVEVVQDCRGPAVSDAELETTTLTLEFSEPVDPATINGSVSLTDNAGGIALSPSVNGETVTFTLARVTSGAAALDVATSVQDLAGNALAFPYVEVFGQGVGDSFIAGIVLDAATGRPLEGAIIKVTASDGVALPEPQPTQTTTADGRILLTVPAGTHDVTFAREGYVPVFRIVTTAAGQGTQVFDPRLEPASAPVSVPVAGGIASDEDQNKARLDIPSGALAATTQVSVSALDEQALPALLPYGWSPRGGVWLETGADLQAPAVLSIPVTSADGTLLDVVALDLATLQWTVVAQPAASAGEVTVGVDPSDTVAAWVAVERDTGALAPPIGVIGQTLGSSPAPVGDEVASATISFDPSTILPTQRSRALVTYTMNADAPSGVPLTLWIEEKLTLLDGSERSESPFPADLILYRDGSGDPSSLFWLTASETARREPVDVGSEVVTLRYYGDESVRGDVLGPDGGSVSNLDGDRLELPAGALIEPTAVIVERLLAADLPLAEPRGATFIGATAIDLGDEALSVPARFVYAQSPAPAAGSEGLLLHVTQIDGEWRYRVVAALEPDAEGWATATIDPLDLPWPGLRESGTYALVELSAPHGFLRGTVQDNSGVPTGGVLIESPSVDWLQISNGDGSYALPLPNDGGSHDVSFQDPQSGDGLTVQVPVSGDRVDLTPSLQAVGPYVEEITPADLAVEVALGQEPTVRFSEPVDRSSLDGEVELLTGGQVVAASLDHQGDLVRIQPLASLLPDTTYQIRVGGGVRDLAGHSLVGALTTIFTTQADPASSDGRLDRDKVRLVAPDQTGEATISGLPGAVPGDSLVYVENLTSYAATESVTADQDGSFTIRIASGLNDRLLLHVLIEGSSEDLMLLGPFLSADERAAWISPEGGRFVSADGYTLIVEQGTFEEGTWVRVEPALIAEAPIESAEDFAPIQDFTVDFGGALANKPLLVSIPVSAGLTAGDDFQLHRFVEVLGERGWMLHSFLRLDGPTLTDIPPGSQTNAATSGALKNAGPQSSVYPPPARQRPWPFDQAQRLAENPDLVYSVPAELGGAEKNQGPLPLSAYVPPRSENGAEKAIQYTPADFAVGLMQEGRYRATRAMIELSYLAYPATQPDLAAWNDAFAPPMISWITPHLWDLGNRRLLVPTPKSTSSSQGTAPTKAAGAGVNVTVGDVATGLIIFEDQRGAPDGLLQTLPEDIYPDTTPPTLISANPFTVIQVSTAIEGTQTLAPGITATRTGDSLTVTGEAGSADWEVQAVLWSYFDGVREAATTTSDKGAFSLQVNNLNVGKPLLLAIGARLTGFDKPLLEFSEAVVPFDFNQDDPVYGIDVLKKEGQYWVATSVFPKAVSRGEKVRLVPSAGFKAGHYRLVFDGLSDANDNYWEGTFELEFEVVQSASVGEFSLPRTADLARYGQLLLAAGSDQGLQIIDVSHPQIPRPYLGVNQGFRLTGSASVRGVDVDPHGFVYFVGGGESSYGVLKVMDLLALDPDAVNSPSDAISAFEAAQKLSVIVSYSVNASNEEDPLPEGLPRRVAVASKDQKDEWFAGDPAPVTTTQGALLDPMTGDYAWVVTGTSTPGRPITLRNMTRGRMERIMTPANGTFTIGIKGAPGDHLRLLRNQQSVAYVTVDGAVDEPGTERTIAGLAAVDVGSLWEQSIVTPQAAANAVHYLSGAAAQFESCDPSRPDVDPTPKDVQVLWQGGNVKVATMIAGFGVRMLNSSSGNPLLLQQRSATDSCASVEEQNYKVLLTAMTSIDDYALDLDGDGKIRTEQGVGDDGATLEVEVRDYVIVSHQSGYILIFDVTDPDKSVRVGKIPLAKDGETLAIAGLEFDRRSKRLYVSAFGSGVYVVDFSSLPSTAEGTVLARLDDDGDGIDDRVLEQIEIAGENATNVTTLPELGLVWAGGRTRGITGLMQGAPELALVNGVGPMARATQTAPFGVPTTTPTGSFPLPGAVRVLTAMPGLAASAEEAATAGATVKVDLTSIAPEGQEIDGIVTGGLPSNEVPPTSYQGDNALELHRLADNPYEDGYRFYLSEPVALIADLRASIAYVRSADENEEENCRRCDQVAEGVYDATPQPSERTKELLSGHRLKARFSESNVGLTEFYENFSILRQGPDVASVPWDISPSVDQEPAHNPSYGFGQVVPGTLLHSGEFTHDATDLTMPALGIPFAFSRTYRNQTVGEGPLGPGWFLGYRTRLRPLPNGDIDFFDGRGRMQTFTAAQGTGTTVIYEAPSGVFLLLKRNAAGYSIFDRAGQRWLFDSAGRLRSILDVANLGDETGSEMTFEYDSRSRLILVSSGSRHLNLDYNDNGRLKSVRDDSGRDVLYGYDSKNRLQTVDSPSVKLSLESAAQRLATTYFYEDEGAGLAQKLNRQDNLTSIEDARSVIWLVQEYLAGADGQGHRLDKQFWGGDELRLTYEESPGLSKTTVFDRRNNEFAFFHKDSGHLKRFLEPAVTDTEGNPAGEASLTEWFFEYDHGLATSVSLPDGRTIETTYVDQDEILDERAAETARPNVSQVKVTPNAAANGVEPEGADPLCRPSAENGSLPLMVTEFQDYHPKTHRPAITLSTRAHRVTSIFDTADRGLVSEKQESIIDPNTSDIQEIRRSAEHDEFGRTTKRQIDRAGADDVVVEQVFKDDGEPTSRLWKTTVDPGGENLTTTYNYGLPGTPQRDLVQSIQTPEGYIHKQKWNDLGWLLESCSPAEAGVEYCTKFTYDELGQLVKSVRPTGESGQVLLATEYEYGELGELELMTLQVSPDKAITESRTYDSNRNVTQIDSTGSAPATFDYDERNRLIQKIDAPGAEEEAITGYVYDSANRMSQTVDARGNVWSQHYDGYGRLMQSVDPLGHYDLTVYDNADHPTSVRRCSSEGTMISSQNMVWDSANRLSSVIRFDLGTNGSTPLVSTFGYDEVGHVVLEKDPRGVRSKYFFDAAQRLREMEVEEPDGTFLFKELYHRDADGRVTVLEQRHPPVGDGNPPNFFTSYQLDGRGLPVTVTDPLNQTTTRRYDAEGQLVRQTLPDGQTTSWAYDGLGRRLRVTQPEGLEVTWNYQDNPQSSVVLYKDAKGQQTTFQFDELTRLNSIEYADGTSESYTLDELGNIENLARADGSTVVLNYDPLNRMTSRTVTPGAGVVGPLIETYTYRDAERRVEVTRGAIGTQITFDSLGRLIEDSTLGFDIGYDYDSSGNASSITYASTEGSDPYSIGMGWNARSQLTSLSGGMTGTFDWLGDRPHKSNLGLFSTARRYDGAGWMRRLETSFNGDSKAAEDIYVDARGLRTHVARAEMGQAGWQWKLDDAGRLIEAKRTFFASGEAVEGSEGRPSSLPSKFSFTYDDTENLLAVTKEGRCQAESVQFALDGSARNRPGNIGDVPLEWDDAGRLTRKGNKAFVYDANDRLVEIKENGGTIATYAYDVQNRRIRRTVGSTTYYTVWDGWRPIEEYRAEGENHVLVSRRTYGLGLDEIVKLELLLPGQTELTTYHPVYDSQGSMIAVLDEAGEMVERYEYSPFGERVIWNDDTPPSIAQLRFESGDIVIELSEAVRDDILDSEINGGVALFNLSKNENNPLQLTRPVTEGRQAKRRLVLSPGEDIEAGDVIRLTVAADALQDYFGNNAEETFLEELTWTGADAILIDETQPRLEEICLIGRKVVVDFSEPVTEVQVANQVLIDNTAVEWVLAESGYSAELSTGLEPGAYSLDLGAGPLDLAGLGLVQATSFSVDVEESGGNRPIFSAPFAGEISSSAIGNAYGFHGLHLDEESGFIYARMRHLDPEMGRFTSPDPLGHIDGPNLYQFALNNPTSYSDPMGESGAATVTGAILGGIGGAAYAGYRSLRHDEDFNWGLVGQGALAGGAVGFGIDTMGAGSGVSASIISGTAIGAGAGGAISSVSSGGDWGEFGEGALKGGILGGIGSATGYGLGAAGRSAYTTFAGSFAADVSAGVALDYAFGDCDRFGNCVESNAVGSLVGAGLGLRQGLGRSRAASGLCAVRHTCFAAGTEVATSEGEVTIEDIEVGDQVWAFNEATGQEELAQVVNLFNRTVDEIYLLHVGDEIIETTAEHPFLVQGEGWTEASSLEAGDLLRRFGGESSTLDRVEAVEGSAEVFNFEVEGLHNYFVSAEQILVHNCEQLDLFRVDRKKWWGQRESDGRWIPIGTAPNPPSKHGNVAGTQPATLYVKYRDGVFQKWGITQHADPRKRYSGLTKRDEVVPIARGPRNEILKRERRLTERFPGPENKEKWAGWRKPGHKNYRGKAKR